MPPRPNPFPARRPRAPANSGRAFWPVLALAAATALGLLALGARDAPPPQAETAQAEPHPGGRPGTPFVFQEPSADVTPLEPFHDVAAASVPAPAVPLPEPDPDAAFSLAADAFPPVPELLPLPPPAPPRARPRPDAARIAARERCRALTAAAQLGDGADPATAARMAEACRAAR